MSDDYELLGIDFGDKPDRGWYAMRVECSICGHRHVSVHPVECESIECSNCGHFFEPHPVEANE